MNKSFIFSISPSLNLNSILIYSKVYSRRLNQIYFRSEQTFHSHSHLVDWLCQLKPLPTLFPTHILLGCLRIFFSDDLVIEIVCKFLSQNLRHNKAELSCWKILMMKCFFKLHISRVCRKLLCGN